MRALRAAAIAMFAFVVWCGAHASAESGDVRPIDAAASKAQFSIQHIFVGHVTGSVPIVSGTVTLAADSVIPIAVTAVLDASKIRTDEPDRDAALESPDYFDTKRFPTWTFATTAIVGTGPAACTMNGLLTMHGVTQPEQLTVTVRGDRTHLVYHAIGRIDRHAFGMRGARLDPVIGDSADVTLDIVVP